MYVFRRECVCSNLVTSTKSFSQAPQPDPQTAQPPAATPTAGLRAKPKLRIIWTLYTATRRGGKNTSLRTRQTGHQPYVSHSPARDLGSVSFP